MLCFLCATQTQAQTTHINNITVEAGGRLHIEVLPPPVAITAFLALSDTEANTQFAGSTLRLAGTAGSISDLFDKLAAAQPANIILTDQTGDVPASAFAYMIWLKSFRADKMTGVGDDAFYQCSALASVSLPEATTIGQWAFQNCPQLTSVSLPKAISIGDYAFRNCQQLTGVSLPEATSIGDDAFANCSNLASVSLPEATSIGNYAFGLCYNLTSVSLPEATTIGAGAFYYCNNLTSVSLPKAITIGNQTFQYCTMLTDISFGANITFFGTNVFTSVPTDTQTTLHLLNTTEYGTASGNTWRGYTFKAILDN